MRVLQLLSDWKWTGPSEPVVTLCRELSRQGLDVDFIHMPRPGHLTGGIPERAPDLDAKTFLTLKKSPNMIVNVLDAIKLGRYIDRTGVDVVHTHTTHDNMIGGWGARASRRRPTVVRTNHTARRIRPGYWPRCLMALVDGLIEICEASRRRNMREYNFPPEHTLLVEGCVPLRRFHRRDDLPDARAEFGLGEGDFVTGIVARVQKHRRFEVLLEAWRLAMAEEPRLRGMLVGRGTHIEEVAKRPAREMGIADRIVFTGYRRGDNYLATLTAMNCLVFLVPGSDGSCRAVREAMALRVAPIATRRGVLPELIEHERCGLIVGDSPRDLADAMLRLARDDPLRRELGKAAERKAHTRFDIKTQAEQTIRFYERLPRKTKPYLVSHLAHR